MSAYQQSTTTARTRLCFSVACLLFAAGCDLELEFSPWQSNVSVTDLTSKHLQLLSETDTGSFEPFTVAIAADVHKDAGELRKTIGILKARGDIAFLLLAGDLTSEGTLKEFTWLADTVEDCGLPVLTVVGNHDGLGNGPEIYDQMFGPLNYAFVYRGVQFIMWNTNHYEWGEPDWDWLQERAQSHSPSVIVAHQPPPAPQPESSDEDYRKYTRQDGSIAAAIHGHQHKFGFHLEDGAVPVYTVAAVDGGQYGIVEFTHTGLRFYDGRISSCKEVGE